MDIKNVFIFLVIKSFNNNRVLLVRTRGKDGFKEYGIPGGIKDNEDKNTLETVKREFKEETNMDLPKINEDNYYDYEDNGTRIYYMIVGDEFNTKKRFIKNKEVDNIYYLNLSKLFEMDNNELKVRDNIEFKYYSESDRLKVAETTMNPKTKEIKNIDIRDSFRKSLNDMIKDNNFKNFIIELLHENKMPKQVDTEKENFTSKVFSKKKKYSFSKGSKKTYKNKNYKCKNCNLIGGTLDENILLSNCNNCNLSNKYQSKYLKYKNKYLELKKIIKN